MATLVARKEHSSFSWDPACEEGAEPFKELRLSSSCCSCSPVSRARGKISICRGGCNTHRLGVLEDAFQKAVARGSVPPDMANRIWMFHPSFKASVLFVGVLCAPILPQDCTGIRFRGCLGFIVCVQPCVSLSPMANGGGAQRTLLTAPLGWCCVGTLSPSMGSSLGSSTNPCLSVWFFEGLKICSCKSLHNTM